MESKHAIGFLFERTTRIIKLRFHQLFKELDIPLTPEQWVVLDILYPNNCLTQKEIVEKSFKDAPSISRIIIKLINNEFITKKSDKKDKRVHNIQLTDSGKELVSRIYPKVQEVRAQGIESLNDEEISNLVKYMNIIFENHS